MRRRIAIAAAWTVGGIFLLLFLEAGIRIAFPAVTAQGIDRRLVRPDAFGTVHGWVPGATGVAFGAAVTIGPEGFRDHNPPSGADSTLLLFGDSVTFGVGVEAESTFAGRLQRRAPRLRIVNTAAVGYTVRDYRTVADAVLPHCSPVARAIIVFSLNDFSTDRPLAVRALPAFAFLREHSRLYLVLKNLLADRSKTYFLHDLDYYRRSSPEVFQALRDLRSLVQDLAGRGIPVSVVVPPYEYQVRRPLPDHLLPQQMIRSALEGAPCVFVDLLPTFLTGPDPAALFLYGDHMHLGDRGHALAAATLWEIMDGSEPAR